MVTVVASFLVKRRVILAELLAVVFACVCAAHLVGRAAVFGVLAVALLVKSFEWDLTAEDGDG